MSEENKQRLNKRISKNYRKAKKQAKKFCLFFFAWYKNERKSLDFC